MNTKESGIFSIFRKPRLRVDFLRRDIAVIGAYYRANGYLEATVELTEIRELENQFVDIIITIVENEATRVESVEFQTQGIISEEKLKQGLLLEAGDPFNPSMLASDVYAIKRHYFDQGYLGVAVRDSTRVEDKRVRIRYHVTPGPVISIRNIEISGNNETKVGIIEKELTLQAGDVFRLRDALETQRNLFETGLFTEVEVVPERLELGTRLVDIVIRVRERKSAYVEFGFGVGNIVGSRVVGEWGDRNPFGTGRLLRFKTEYSFGFFVGDDEFEKFDPGVKFYRYDGEFGQRRVFGTKVQLRLNAFYEKDATVEDIIIRTRGAAIGGTRHLTENTDLFMQLSQERVKRQAPDEDDEESTSNIVGSTISRDTRDFILDPRQGSYRDLALQFAGGPLFGDNDFYTISSSVQKYWKVANKTILALRVRAGFADAFGDSKDKGVPIENRFFTGGGNSVRGYGENSLGPTQLIENTDTGLFEPSVVGGRALMLTNVELRFPLPLLSRYRFSGAVFADGGNVWASLRSIDFENFRPYVNDGDIRQQDYRYSLGLGIRYNTPVGPIRLDYGFPVKSEPGVDRSGRIHFSLGQMF
jgi:outer membrane protein insertion porin family